MMRRGRVLIYMAIGAGVVTCAFGSVARADDGGSAAAICADLQDGKVDGSYTADQWNAFLHDPTIQGYCSVIVPAPAVVAGVKGASQTVTSASQPTTALKGAQHTVGARAASAAPIATTKKTSGTLPFTGAQLGLFLLAGLTLVASGLLLRSTGRPTRQRH
jgi:hypothetical protein